MSGYGSKLTVALRRLARVRRWRWGRRARNRGGDGGGRTATVDGRVAGRGGAGDGSSDRAVRDAGHAATAAAHRASGAGDGGVAAVDEAGVGDRGAGGVREGGGGDDSSAGGVDVPGR